MNIRKSYIVGGFGWLVNLFYWASETYVYGGVGNLIEDFQRAPTEHLVILSYIPVFMLVGYLFETVEEHSAQIRRRSEFQVALNRLLQSPLGEVSLEEMLERAIDQVVSIPWLALESKGGIFLVEDDPGTLVLKAHRELPDALLDMCARVPFGRCLCGRAADSGGIIFADHVDERHENQYGGMTPHGHYCVPIRSGGRTMGVIVLYVQEGHSPRNEEKEFLNAIANVLAGTIQRKRAEEAIREYAAELEEANRLKDLFIDIMRHDLLNPAGSVRNAADLLLDEETDEDKRELVQIIRSHNNTLIEMIQSASKYSKLKETEELEGEIRDLGAILKEAVQYLSAKLQGAGMTVDYQANGEYPARVNPLIWDVFSNLITNAIKYAPEGKKIEVGVLDRAESWDVYVKDWGGGIPDEHKEKLFTRFERLGKECVEGTGLGLAIARRIVELHCGRIWVEDNPEGGSIFYVSLPKGKGS